MQLLNIRTKWSRFICSRWKVVRFELSPVNSAINIVEIIREIESQTDICIRSIFILRLRLILSPTQNWYAGINRFRINMFRTTLHETNIPLTSLIKMKWTPRGNNGKKNNHKMIAMIRCSCIKWLIFRLKPTRRGKRILIV